jgi:threonine/homoserine/homoserine lactone efflux protein
MPEITAALVAGVTAGLAVAVPLGPIGVMIVDTGIRDGGRAAFAAGLGTATVDGLYALAAALFGAALAGWLTPAADTLRLAAAAVLIAIAGYGLLRLRRPTDAGAEPSAPPPAHHLFARFFALTAVNPLTAATFAALMLGLPAVADGSAVERALFVAGAFAASLAWQSTLAGSGALLGHRLPPAGRRWTSLAGNLIVLGLAVRLIAG